MAKTYQERIAEQQRAAADEIDRMARLPSRPERVTAAEMARCKEANADLYRKGGKR